VFERFTDDGRQAVELAQEEAQDLRHPHVGTEHLLLGLLRQKNGLAAQALTELGLTLEAAREQVERIIGSVEEPPSGRIPFTPRAEKVLALAVREAQSLGHREVHTEHVLLAIRDEGEGVGARVLQGFTIHSAQIREQLGLL
jgi:ATP-dependent Clp protease ATP-binding subunit ClpC